MKYFLDSYAIIEILKGNKVYIKYLDFDCKTSIFNLYEVLYNLLKIDEKSAEDSFKEFLKFQIEIEEGWFIEAAKFKLSHKARGLSYADCIGYIAALKTDRLFLTGDKEFRDMPNVEFVKMR